LTQDLDILNQGGFYPENVENEFDLQEMQIQQLDEEVNRSVRGNLTETWPEVGPPPERAGKLLAFTDDANAYPTVEVTDILVDLLSAILQAGPGISITIGDGIITISNTAPGGDAELQECWLLENASSGGGGGGADAETIRDIIGIALQGLGCVITVDDAGNTITVDCTQDATQEVIRDTVGATLVAGANVTITPNDGANTITIASSAVAGQPSSATLTGIAAEGPVAANKFLYTTAEDVFDSGSITTQALALLDDVSAAAMLTTLGAAAAPSGTFSANTLSVEVPLASGTLLIQGGKGTLAADTSGSIVFPTAYSIAPVCGVWGSLSDHTQEGSVDTVGAASTTGQAIINSAGGGTITYQWIAIGKK
jgi:hypothetical protein